MKGATDVAVIGAGPYGLSLAAHLRARRIDFRVIGTPMQTWRTHMPHGMHLKSDGFASNLYDPDRAFPLSRFCAERNLPYADLGLPVPLDMFCAYGLAFQKRFVPQLETKILASLRRLPGRFMLTLANGEVFAARKVVLALGIDYFRHVPPELAALPPELCTHAAAHAALGRFRNRRVLVIGAGASAVDLAVLLHEAGADVQLVARRREIDIHTKLQLPRPLWERLRFPVSGIGPSWRSRFFTDAPLLFHCLPEEKRLGIVSRYLGPAAGWFMRERFANVRAATGCRLAGATVERGRTRVECMGPDGAARSFSADHVIAATGYRVDLRRIPVLSDELRAALRTVEHTPILSARYESSVPGLYFIGPASANAFGPAMRFAFGARTTAPWVARAVARSLRRRLFPAFAGRGGQPQPEHGLAGRGADEFHIAAVGPKNLLRDRKP